MASTQNETNQRVDNNKNNNPPPTNPLLFSLKIGFFAGFVWGLVRWLATGLNFTKVTQAFLLDPFVKRKLLDSFYWQLAGWVSFIVMSIIAAFIYVVVLGKLKGPWPGVWMGAIVWVLVYALAGPIIGAVPPLREIGWNSIVTDFCLFVVWGLFIGYSIAFELHNESEREPAQKSAKGSPMPSS
jgi:uncharacterized membrane protein YagU involved in acid resistance